MYHTGGALNSGEVIPKPERSFRIIRLWLGERVPAGGTPHEGGAAFSPIPRRETVPGLVARRLSLRLKAGGHTRSLTVAVPLTVLIGDRSEC